MFREICRREIECTYLFFKLTIYDLISKGANVNAKDKLGDNVIHSTI